MTDKEINTMIDMAREIESPANKKLRDLIWDEEPDMSVSVETTAKIAAEIVRSVLDVTLTPSTVDISEMVYSNWVSLSQRGLNPSDIIVVMQHAFAAFGFTGDECDEIAEFYGDYDDEDEGW